MAKEDLNIPTNNAEYDFIDEDVSVFKTPKGLNEDIVREISRIKNEPEWMLEFRLKCLKHFNERPLPSFGPSLKEPAPTANETSTNGKIMMSSMCTASPTTVLEEITFSIPLNNASTVELNLFSDIFLSS